MILMTLLVAAGVIISLYPFQEYTFTQQPYSLVNKQIKIGEPLLVKAKYCKLSNASGVISTIFEGDRQYVSPSKTFQAKKGCVDTILTIPLPDDLTPGLYRFHGHGEYTKYLVGKAKVDTYSEYFTIIK